VAVGKGRHGGAPVLWVLVALLGLGTFAAWALLFVLLRQHGALLLRFERLEESLVASGLTGFESESGPDGLPVGTQFPPFRIADVRGGIRALDDYRGKRVMLVHWSPGCGFCDAIAPDLAKAVPELRRHNTELVLVTAGDRETNGALAREYGFDCAMLLEDSVHAVEGFSGIGTPAAYLLDEEGRGARGLVVGADKVPELLDDALAAPRDLSLSKRPVKMRPLSESRLERDGLRPGARAPAFTLPTIDGRTVALDAYRGRRLLIVFSDPECGPCEQLLPELAARHERARESGLEFVMVSRGDAEDNRRKSTAYGVAFPVGLQRGWRLSKEYGIFATPVGFLIDADGVITRPVAKGPEAIVALLEAEIGAREERPLEV
jgi:peroxiredoxin